MYRSKEHALTYLNAERIKPLFKLSGALIFVGDKRNTAWLFHIFRKNAR